MRAKKRWPEFRHARSTLVPLEPARVVMCFGVSRGAQVDERLLITAGGCAVVAGLVEPDDIWSAALGDADCCAFGGANVPWPYP